MRTSLITLMRNICKNLWISITASRTIVLLFSLSQLLMIDCTSFVMIDFSRYRLQLKLMCAIYRKFGLDIIDFLLLLVFWELVILCLCFMTFFRHFWTLYFWYLWNFRFYLDSYLAESHFYEITSTKLTLYA